MKATNKQLKAEDNCLTFCEIDLKAVKHNLREIRKVAKKNKFYLPTRDQNKKKTIQDVDILPVIKADAYGHGMDKIAQLLDRENVGFLGVSDLSEGIRLRKLGIKKPILLFESTLPELIKRIVYYKLMPTICSLKLAKQLDQYAKKVNKRIDVHIKVDTGMGRLGVWHEEAYPFIKELHKLTNLRLMGVLTHFPAADTDKKFTHNQIQYLYELVTRLDKEGIVIPYIHAANSMGLAGYRTHILNLARPGLLLYGLYPHESLKSIINLKPAMAVYSRVIFLKSVKKGRSISYGRTFFTKKDMKIATVPIGYNDGYFRALSNKGFVLIKGQKCCVVGRVTMDQIMVDVSDVKNLKEGDQVVIIGKQKNVSISATELADYANTISYEIVCSLGNNLPRFYK